MKNKLAELKEIIAAAEGAIVAYSGGVDSTFLAKIAHEVLGDKVLMVTAASPLQPQRELDMAAQLATQFGFRQQIIRTNELEDETFAANSPDRCYHCKKALFARLGALANQHCLAEVFDGTNYDDQTDFRPGMQAIRELGVRSPLAEAGLTKAEIRVLSKEYKLPTWDKPALACLASRFPYGEYITAEKLVRVEQAELFLSTLALKQLRVRYHGELARIEVPASDLDKVIGAAANIVTYFKKLGFYYITLDLEGYRTGSLNEVLQLA